MAVPMASSAKVVTFGGFKCRVASFWVAGVALRDSQIWFHNMLKIVLCGRCDTFASLQEDELRFPQHFGDLHRHFAWRLQHFGRVMLRVFCESHCQGFVKWGRRANWVASVAFTEMCWKLTEASRETSILRSQILRFMRKLVGKRRFWSYEVWKLEEVSHEMVVLRLQHVSSRVSGFPVALPCLWGKLQNLSFLKPWKQVRLSCRFAWQGWHFLTFSCLKNCRNSFCVTGAILLRRFQKMSWIFGSRRNTLHFTLKFTLYTLHFTLCTPHSTLNILLLIIPSNAHIFIHKCARHECCNHFGVSGVGFYLPRATRRMHAFLLLMEATKPGLLGGNTVLYDGKDSSQNVNTFSRSLRKNQTTVVTGKLCWSTNCRKWCSCRRSGFGFHRQTHGITVCQVPFLQLLVNHAFPADELHMFCGCTLHYFSRSMACGGPFCAIPCAPVMWFEVGVSVWAQKDKRQKI